MPDQATIRKARRDARQGKSASTQAGEFIHDEIRKIRRGKHGARNTKQAIAIGLSEARRAGVKLPARKGRTSAATRKKAKQDTAASKRHRPTSRKRSRATLQALRREPRSSASKRALSRQGRQAARRRSPGDRSRSARKAAMTRRHRMAA